jgi:hypothetical protein
MLDPSDETLFREASDPATSPIRLSQLLDLCSTQRMELAGPLRSACENMDSDPKQLESAARDKSLRKFAQILASNPHLSREQWVRACELSPPGALNSPVLKQLLDAGSPIIVTDFEFLALGELARHCLANSGDRPAVESLAQIILAGLPEPTYSFGTAFRAHAQSEVSAWRDSAAGVAIPCADGHCISRRDWSGEMSVQDTAYLGQAVCMLWKRSEQMFFVVGNVIMDALEQGASEAAREASFRCAEFGLGMLAVCDDYLLETFDGQMGELKRMHLAGPEEATFGKCVYTTAGIDRWSGHQMAGWEVGGLTHWLGVRPPMLPGRVHQPNGIGKRAWEGVLPEFLHALDLWICPESGSAHFDLAGIGMGGVGVGLAPNGSGTLLSCISGDLADGTVGIAVLRGCALDRPFPEPEVARLAGLFGSKSGVLRFARSPKCEHCPECGGILLLVDTFDEDVIFTCMSCDEHIEVDGN